MNTYLLFKSIHLIAVISWMAGLLYLPRIFVYHVEASNNENQNNTFKIMERKLYFYIMNPAMILSWIFGLLLLHSIGLENFNNLWLKLKLFLVILLTIYHFFLFSIDSPWYTNILGKYKSPTIQEITAIRWIDLNNKYVFILNSFVQTRTFYKLTWTYYRWNKITICLSL